MSRAHPLATAPEARGAHGVSGSLATTAAARLGSPGRVVRLAVLPGLYGLAVVLLLASRVREFADESDNLLGGYLIARGDRLYADYFSNHMPLPYYLAALPSLLGASRIEQYRLFTDALLVASTLGLAWGLMARRGLGWTLAGAWATIAVFAHTVQWGEMLHAGTCAAYGLLAAGLLFYTTPGLRFSGREQMLLASAVFVAVQSELLSIYPLALLGGCYLVARVSDARRGTSALVEAHRSLRLLLLVLAPQVVVLLGLAAVGALGAFVYDAYLFNQTYYARFVMNGSILGMLHDWEAQYRTYLLASLQNPFGLEGCLVLANLAACLLVARARGPAVAVAYLAFVSLSRVRNGAPYYLTSYLSLAILVTWALATLVRRVQRTEKTPLGDDGAAAALSGARPPGMQSTPGAALAGPALLALCLVAAFVLQVARTYDFSSRPAYAAPEQPILDTITSPDERIFVAPYDPYLYLAAGRLPVSTFEFYFPWQAADPKSDGQILAELHARHPAAVVFRQDELVNGQYRTGDWAGHLRALLDAEGYAPLDPNTPGLAEVFVPRERLAEARARLSRAGLAGP